MLCYELSTYLALELFYIELVCFVARECRVKFRYEITINVFLNVRSYNFRQY